MEDEAARMDLRTDADSIRFYCRHHELNRPHINWLLIVSVIVAFELLVYACFGWLPLSTGSFLLLDEAVHIAVFLVFGRSILQLTIKIYQRYAPESLRRQCSCQPTCSEYALLALQKYIWPKALILIIRRVAITCQEPGYKTDYP
ncbi:MAG: membrane protein insertion efficiency factor YidD [Bacteroidaceae bacterium]|nr:membrane protein insertion efficiency factor YidD [Bacteroidaceae bacterium]